MKKQYRLIVSWTLSVLMILNYDLSFNLYAADKTINKFENLSGDLSSSLEKESILNLENSSKLAFVYAALVKTIEENRKSGVSQIETLKLLSRDKNKVQFWNKSLQSIDPSSFPAVEALGNGILVHVNERIHFIQITGIKPLKISINKEEAELSSDNNLQKDQKIIERLLERAESKGKIKTSLIQNNSWSFISQAHALAPVLLAAIGLVVALSSLAVLESIAIGINITLFLNKLDNQAKKCESNPSEYSAPDVAIMNLFDISQKSMDNCEKEIVESQGDSFKLFLGHGPSIMQKDEANLACRYLRRIRECLLKSAQIPGSKINNSSAGKAIVDYLQKNSSPTKSSEIQK